MPKVQRHVFPTCRILYSALRGGKSLPEKYEDLAGLIYSFGGTIHGSQFTASESEYVGDKIIVYFNIPITDVEQFLNEEQALGRDQSENTATK